MIILTWRSTLSNSDSLLLTGACLLFVARGHPHQALHQLRIITIDNYFFLQTIFARYLTVITICAQIIHNNIWKYESWEVWLGLGLGLGWGWGWVPLCQCPAHQHRCPPPLKSTHNTQTLKIYHQHQHCWGWLTCIASCITYELGINIINLMDLMDNGNTLSVFEATDDKEEPQVMELHNSIVFQQIIWRSRADLEIWKKEISF